MMKLPKTPTWLSRKYLHVFSGCRYVDIVERQLGPIKRDLFGFADLLALRDLEEFSGVSSVEYWFVQTTSMGEVKKRKDKLTKSKICNYLVNKGGMCFVHGWKYYGEGMLEVQASLLLPSLNWADTVSKVDLSDLLVSNKD